MRYVSTSLLAASLILVFSFGTQTQDNSSNKPPVRKFKHKSKVETIYDKAKNQTTTYLRPMTLRYAKSSVEARIISESRTDFLPSETLYMTAYFVSAGKVLSKPEAVVIGFRSQALDQTKYANALTLTIKLDDSSMELGSMQVTERRIEAMGSYHYLFVSFESSLPYESFQRITNARKVMIRIAGEEIELTTDHLEAFRDLLSRAG